MSPAQQRALAELLPRYGIPFAPQAARLRAAFGRSAPRVLEIGFGMGETTAAIAAAHPDVDFLGVEVHAPGVGACSTASTRTRLANVRVIQHDAVEVVAAMIAARLARRRPRLLSRPVAEEAPPQAAPAATRLSCTRSRCGSRPAATCTSRPTGRTTRRRSSRRSRPSRCSQNAAPGFAPRPAWRPLTKFETRGLKLGHGVWDVMFRGQPAGNRRCSA